jgi:catechol 2,3-dioxygenase-like lactoylglutathione lyase family enzyme
LANVQELTAVMSQKQIKSIGVAHFSIPVSNLDKSVAFYTENIGLRLTGINKEGMAFLDANGVAIILVQTDKPNSSAFEPRVHHSFLIAHDDFADVVTQLETRGVKLDHEDVRKVFINGPRVYMWDPDGHQIELLDRTSYAGHYL